jgi:hypothetical protein
MSIQYFLAFTQRRVSAFGGLMLFSAVAGTAGSAAIWKKANDLDSQEQERERKNKPTRGTNAIKMGTRFDLNSSPAAPECASTEPQRSPARALMAIVRMVERLI